MTHLKKICQIIKPTVNFFAYNTWLLFLIAALCIFCLLLLSKNTLLNKKGDVLVEVFGFFMDIILFGIILMVYDKWKSKRLQVREYYNQLRAFRTWSDEEGILRKVDIIRQLTEEMKVPLPEMSNIILTHAGLSGVDLSNVKMPGAKLSYAFLNGANLSGVHLFNVDMFETKLYNADLSGADLTEAKNLTKAQLLTAKTLYNTKGLDINLKKQIEKEAPQLFEKPEV